MHALFVAWAKSNAVGEWSSKSLAPALKEPGLTAKRSNGMWWLNVALTKRESDFADTDTARKNGAPADEPSSDADEVNF
jgi:hypothetical protein